MTPPGRGGRPSGRPSGGPSGGSGDDGPDDATGPVPAAAPAQPESVAGGAWWAGDGPPVGESAGPGATGGDPAGLPPLPPSSRARRPREPWIPEPPPFRALSGPDIAGIVLLGALGIGVLVVLGLFVLNRFDQRDPVVAASPAVGASAAPTVPPTSAATSRATGTPTPASAGPTPTAGPEVTTPGRIRSAAYSGPLAVLRPASAGASCTDKPIQDSSGREIAFDAANTLDDNPQTAWRCRGRAVGKRLTITFDQPTTVAELGIVNGWAKGRADSSSDQYRANRRLETVRYRFDGDRWIDQHLDTTDRSTQTLRIPATTTRTLVVEIRTVSSARRNYTAISELTFSGPP